MIIQFMCDPRIRDGTTTTTIPDKPTECYNFDCDTDVRFGRHESYEWYQQCKSRSRNKVNNLHCHLTITLLKMY
jgi:hypothetical protein